VPAVRAPGRLSSRIDKRLRRWTGRRRHGSAVHKSFWYGRDRDLAAQIVRAERETARALRVQADRFAAFASLTLQAPDLAVGRSSRPQ